MKRVKIGIKRNRRESTMKGSLAKNDGFSFPMQDLITENELFDGIQEQMFDALVKSKQ